MKLILAPLEVLNDTERTVCGFGDVEIHAKPGSHVNTLRGYSDIKFILIDEASFWIGEGESNEIRSVAEGYIAKTHPIIAMVSTPSVPGTMFEKIMEEDSKCLYKRYRLPYTVGLNKIYSPEEIDMARLSPHFEREYNLKYGIGTGNLFEDRDIDDIIVDELPNHPLTRSISIGCDPGFGSSNAAYCIVGQLSYPLNKLVVLESKQFERGSFRAFSNLMFDKFQEYKAARLFVDASARDVVDDLKLALRENTNYEPIMKQAAHDYPYLKDAWMQSMVVCPIAFNKYNDRMLHHIVYLVQSKEIMIPKKFEELILDLRMAREKGGKLEKNSVNARMDLLDALRMACLMFEYEQ
jgi:hypothetical protein